MEGARLSLDKFFKQVGRGRKELMEETGLDQFANVKVVDLGCLKERAQIFDLVIVPGVERHKESAIDDQLNRVLSENSANFNIVFISGDSEKNSLEEWIHIECKESVHQPNALPFLWIGEHSGNFWSLAPTGSIDIMALRQYRPLARLLAPYCFSHVRSGAISRSKLEVLFTNSPALMILFLEFWPRVESAARDDTDSFDDTFDMQPLRKFDEVVKSMPGEGLMRFVIDDGSCLNLTGKVIPEGLNMQDQLKPSSVMNLLEKLDKSVRLSITDLLLANTHLSNADIARFNGIHLLLPNLKEVDLNHTRIGPPGLGKADPLECFWKCPNLDNILACYTAISSIESKDYFSSLPEQNLAKLIFIPESWLEGKSWQTVIPIQRLPLVEKAHRKRWTN